MSRLQEKYRKTVVPAMQKAFEIKNVMAVPKMEKVVINTGIGRIVKEDKTIERMSNFLDRLISISLPRSRDFRGIDSKNFDKMGNLNFGIKESSIFPEVNYENVKDVFGLEVTVVTTAKNRERGIELLRQIGFPIKK